MDVIKDILPLANPLLMLFNDFLEVFDALLQTKDHIWQQIIIVGRRVF